MPNQISLLDVKQNTAKCPSCKNKLFFTYPSSIRCTFCLKDYAIDDTAAFFVEVDFYKNKVKEFDSKVLK